MEVVIGGTYVHYKQKKYKVMGLARHSETLEEMVIYECLYQNDQGQIWVRPISLFCGEVTTDGYKGPRFKLCEIKD